MQDTNVEQAVAALRAKWNRSLVAVVSNDVDGHHIGSGILVRGGDGQVGVLTVAHVAKHVEQGKPSELGWEEQTLTRTRTGFLARPCWRRAVARPS